MTKKQPHIISKRSKNRGITRTHAWSFDGYAWAWRPWEATVGWWFETRGIYSPFNAWVIDSIFVDLTGQHKTTLVKMDEAQK